MVKMEIHQVYTKPFQQHKSQEALKQKPPVYCQITILNAKVSQIQAGPPMLLPKYTPVLQCGTKLQLKW